MKLSPSSCYFLSPRSKYSPQYPVLKHLQYVFSQYPERGRRGRLGVTKVTTVPKAVYKTHSVSTVCYRFVGNTSWYQALPQHFHSSPCLSVLLHYFPKGKADCGWCSSIFHKAEVKVKLSKRLSVIP